MQHLAQCYLALGKRAEAKDLLQQLLVLKPKPRPQPKQEKPAAEQETAEHGIVADATVADASVDEKLRHPEAPRSHRGGEGSPAQPAATEAEQPTEQAAAATDTAEPKPRPWADLLLGIIQFEENDMDAALTCLLKAESADPHLPDLHLRIGETYLRQKRTDDADRAFQRALEIDGDSPEAHLGLAVVRLRQRRNEEAAEQALLAVGLQHFLPLGHFYLGVALARLGHRDRSALAFETALSMLPGLMAAHRWLAALYTHPNGDLEKATRHREIFLRMRKQRQGQKTA
jgi:tetratricopeptide (TPR) repeat protein